MSLITDLERMMTIMLPHLGEEDLDTALKTAMDLIVPKLRSVSRDDPVSADMLVEIEDHLPKLQRRIDRRAQALADGADLGLDPGNDPEVLEDGDKL